MSERWNFPLGLANAVWSAAISLLAIPFYLHYLGLEAYGLVGFLAALQAIFSVLDLGLTPTMSREVARCRATGDLGEARSLLHTLAVIYWIAAVSIGVGVAAAAPFIAQHWLNGSALSAGELQNALVLMGLVIALRWPTGVYGGVLIGDSKLAQFSLLGIVASTLTSFGAVGVLAFVSPTVDAFFIWQAGAAAMLVVAMRVLAWKAIGTPPRRRFDVDALRRVWRFSAGLGVASILGVIFMQSDKVVLSRLVTLEALGTYTLAGALARTLYIVLSPTFNIIYPRLTGLVAAGSQAELSRYYSTGTRLLTSVIFPFAAFVAIFAHPLVASWTGDPAVASRVAPLVPWLIAGTALNGLMHFPYALQLAAGRSRLPATINLVLLVAFVPLLAWLTLRFGVVGAAAAWAVLNGGYVLVGTYLTHRTIMVGQGWRWLAVDVAPVVAITVIVAGMGGLAVRSSSLPEPAQIAAGALLAGTATLLSCTTYHPLAAIIADNRRSMVQAFKRSLTRLSDVA